MTIFQIYKPAQMEILSEGKNDTLVKLFNHSKIKNAEKNAVAS